MIDSGLVARYYGSDGAGSQHWREDRLSGVRQEILGVLFGVMGC